MAVLLVQKLHSCFMPLLIAMPKQMVSDHFTFASVLLSPRAKVSLYTLAKSRLGSFLRGFLRENVAPHYKQMSGLLALSLPEKGKVLNLFIHCQ